MIDLSNEHVEGLLRKLNWAVLSTKKPEYIAIAVVRQMRKNGIRFVKEGKEKKVKVIPISRFDKDHSMHGQLIYSYYKNWTGVILKEWNNGTVDLAEVRIKKSATSKNVVITIRKDDLCLIKE